MSSALYDTICHTHFPKDPARLTDLHDSVQSVDPENTHGSWNRPGWQCGWSQFCGGICSKCSKISWIATKTKGVTAEQNNVLSFYLTSGSAQTHHHNWREAMLVLSKLVFSLTHRTWQGFGSACKLICFSHNLHTVWNPGTLIWRPERSHISELVGHCQANVRDVVVFSGFGHGKQNLQQNAKCKQVGENPKKTNNDF